MKILLLCSTTDGHTWNICESIQKQIQEAKYEVLLVHIEDFEPNLLTESDAIMIGASIRYGKHNKKVYEFINSYAKDLETKVSSFFSVNLVARKSEKRTAETNPYVRKFLKQMPWTPKQVGVFAGKLNYPLYGFFDRIMIQLIMYMTKGPTNPTTVREYTNWEDVKDYTNNFIKLI